MYIALMKLVSCLDPSQVATRVEAIAARVEALAIRLEARPIDLFWFFQ